MPIIKIVYYNMIFYRLLVYLLKMRIYNWLNVIYLRSLFRQYNGVDHNKIVLVHNCTDLHTVICKNVEYLKFIFSISMIRQ